MPKKESEKNNKEDWINQIRQGDEKAFEKLFKEYYFSLSRFAWRYVKSKAVAEELVQEVFTCVWNDRECLEPAGSIRSYFYQAVKHRAIDYLRHQEVRQKHDPVWMEEKKQPMQEYNENIREEEIKAAIKQEVENLPTRSRMTYKLHRHDGLTYKEIADVMDVSVKTVETHMSRALKQLRERLRYLLPLISVGIMFGSYLFISL